jgi:tRNA(Arg) A34 adenosine deaminase TadA
VAIRSLTTQRRQVNLDMRPDSGPFAGALLYATLEPCPMCCWLSSITGLRGIVVGARHTDLDVSFGQYTMEKLMALAGRRVELVTGILAEQCMTMVRSGPFKPGPR